MSERLQAPGGGAGGGRRIVSPRRLGVLLCSYALVAAILYGILWTGRRILFREVQEEARNLAELVALNIDSADLRSVHAEDDMQSVEYKRALDYLQSVKRVYGHLAFVYTLRCDPGTQAWSFVVDADPYDEDENGDGTISPNEEGTIPGDPYNDPPASLASGRALHGPTAEDAFYTDYWGTFMSGFAPIVDQETGDVVVLGVDITRATFKLKYRALVVVAGLAFVPLCLLVSWALFSLYGKTEALEVVQALDRRIQKQNAELRDTVGRLHEREETMRQDLLLAQEVQLHVLPHEFPLKDWLGFAASYRTCELIGGDFYDAFELGEHSAGFFIADVSGHGVSAALLTTALKASLDRCRGIALDATRTKPACAGEVDASCVCSCLRELNRVMYELLPVDRFITFAIAVFDLENHRLLIGNAGHPPPIRCRTGEAEASMVQVPPNVAIGLLDDFDYQTAVFDLRQGDKIVFYTDGLTERLNTVCEEYGEERLQTAVGCEAGLTPAQLIARIVKDAEHFSGNIAPHDDEAIVAIEVLDGSNPGVA
ncbi:MAG: PP2C family protein-serine/threonine phosphatase [Verrucomicrobiota bacterium]